MIIKSIHHAEQKLLLKILPDYVEYISKNPNTLLARYYGLHRMKIPGQQKPIHFVVMANVFPPNYDIHLTFDLKGSTIGRETSPEDIARKGKKAVLKDINWLKMNRSLCSARKKPKCMLGWIGPGRWGSYLYYSHDYSMIIKSIHHAEQKLLLKILPDYVEYISKNPNTLLARYYGLHRMKIPGQQKPIHFVVMANVFPPNYDVHLTFDLKGSTIGRETSPEDIARKGKKAVLKDINWLKMNRRLMLGPEKAKMFTDQLERDMLFLMTNKIMDYSLLIGVHDLTKGNGPWRDQQIRVFEANVFPPNYDVHLTFDLKGSTIGRETSPEDIARKGKKAVLKDINWLKMNRRLMLGPEKAKMFTDQLERDMLFLMTNKIMDYSLLIGVHDLTKGNGPWRDQQIRVFEPNRQTLQRTPSTSRADAVRRALQQPEIVAADRISALQLPPVNSRRGHKSLFVADNGSTIGRETSPEDIARKGKKAVLKDINWLKMNRRLMLGPEKAKMFTDQLERDMLFLMTNKIMDYSLLIGVHDLTKGNGPWRDQQIRVFEPNRQTLQRTPSTSRADAVRRALQQPEIVAADRISALQLPPVNSRRGHKSLFVADNGGILATDQQNRPGTELYFLSIIDILTPYNATKKIEHAFKSVTQDRHQISAVNPVEYGKRFVAFMKGLVGTPAAWPVEQRPPALNTAATAPGMLENTEGNGGGGPGGAGGGGPGLAPAAEPLAANSTASLPPGFTPIGQPPPRTTAARAPGPTNRSREHSIAGPFK
ncbi:hypothetical protein AMAG_19114 [Allomyces macrogynus ATCC 38327]|uniref:PIPK domain-containing protein n=1 Tax=Allomyces macrogynus (strain ATCC 38327) TaxID=578462 RepID=A0A0L0SP23_ALLM3|nr:hypothetical protein AMAG_19114 [Allomyces macrogynus ATCC 38327]|eukprot:KNE64139.1 hypothetical protein AMAG_19114 [Allomyces macrogynus ATCC 38327]